MSTLYEQTSGTIQMASGLIFSGYSGHGKGLNNPAEEAVVGEGPIPAGEWEVVSWTEGEAHYIDHHGHDKGPIVAILKPVGHDAHGRSGFLCHGDNPLMNHTASDGCIVTGRTARLAWRASGDRKIFVVAKQGVPHDKVN